MLLSLSLIFLCGIMLGYLFECLHLPKLLGTLVTGILLGPYVLKLLDGSILAISADLRQIALIVILLRAGLNLDMEDLKKAGRPAVLLCFVPACFEIMGMVILAPKLLGMSLLEAAILGTVVGAVSPAVIVPRMLTLMEQNYGTKKSIPQMILAGASVDDVFVIVLFTAFIGFANGEGMNVLSFAKIPVSIVLGVLAGLAAGLVLTVFFKRIHMRDSGKVILLFSVSFLFVTVEHQLTGIITMSGLLAVMSMGATLKKYHTKAAIRLSDKFSKLWVAAELLLFVLVGAEVNIGYALSLGIISVILVLGVLVFRMCGVLLCMAGTALNRKERLFAVVAYLPKATVQAAIGSIPLAMGLSCGNTVLTIAVVSILVTAPLGAILIDLLYKRLLQQYVHE